MNLVCAGCESGKRYGGYLGYQYFTVNTGQHIKSTAQVSYC